MLNLRAILICALMACTAYAADPPRPSLPLELLRPGAPSLTLNQYRGKFVVLALIHTSCSHCQQFTAVLNILAREYEARGVQFLECAFNDDARVAMPEFQQRFKPSFPVGYNSPAAINTYLRRSVMDTHPLYVPRLLVLDRAGMIRAEYPGEDPFFHSAETGLRTLLDELLKPAATAKK